MFKDKLKKLRQEKNLTQQELGDAIYVSRSAICKWEMGIGVPSEVNIKTLCQYFNVDESWLFDEVDQNQSDKILVQTKKVFGYNKITIIVNVLVLILSILLLSVTRTYVTPEESFKYSFFDLYTMPEKVVFFITLIFPFFMELILLLYEKNIITINFDNKKILYVIKLILFLIVSSFIMFILITLIRYNNYRNFINGIEFTDVIIYDIIYAILLMIIMLAISGKFKLLQLINIILFVLQGVAFIFEIIFIGYIIYYSSLPDSGLGIAAALILFLFCSIPFLILTIMNLICSVILSKKSSKKLIVIINVILSILGVIAFGVLLFI